LQLGRIDLSQVVEASDDLLVFFGLGILPDLKNSKKMGAYLGSGGIGLP